jgi:pantetheine-phosphate adenylyltransferase
MAHAVFAGSFDPPTLGHLDIIARAASVFETLHVVIAVNRNKHALFRPEERFELLSACTASLPNVRIAVWEGLVVDFSRENDCTVLVRGVRNTGDFSVEYDMSILNRTLEPSLETFLICAEPRYAALSSTAVKEFLHFGRDVSTLVPSPVSTALENRKA